MVTKTLQAVLWMALTLMAVGCQTMTRPFHDGGHQEDDGDGRWFREMRIDGWTMLISDDSQILAVRQKLEQMFGSGAPEVKVDMANPRFSDGNWHYEFSRLAQAAISRSNYMDAAGYYTLAAYPMAYGDRRAVAMYDHALDTFEKALDQGQYPYRPLTVTVEGVDITAYLVFPQSFEPGAALPVIVETGGTDSLMPFNFANYLRHWNRTGAAWVGFDIPGHGTAYDLPLTYDAEKLHVAVIEALKATPGIDGDNIFVIGRSAGGYAALRLIVTGKADDLGLAGVVAFCPIAEHIFSRIIEDETLIQEIDPVELNTWCARTKVDPKDTQAIVASIRPFRFSSHGLWGRPFSAVPLLVYNSANDFVNPVAEMKEMAALSKNGKFMVAKPEFGDDDGHCGCRREALRIFAGFVADNMR